MPSSLRVTFPKSRERGRLSVFEWAGGLVATCPIWNTCDRLPHDLEHYIVEAQFRPQYGFWSLASQQAPFASLTLVRGQWPRGRQEWLDRVRRKHGAEMLKAESVGIGPVADPAVDIDAVWATRARTMRKAYALAESNPFANATRNDFVELRERHLAFERAWQKVPLGGALIVTWPPDAPPKRVLTYAGHRAPAHQ